eukprot:TRINITY_DN16241_c0_g1_i1.p1 TRINITY_DN16241_c0_g1~~TRINITY_DN16241_c0_g1_i1.p1  ORF type:complete len:135 (-),score=6.70 TRINITY_DN16241_c0_g1_i1:13-417(-)
MPSPTVPSMMSLITVKALDRPPSALELRPAKSARQSAVRANMAPALILPRQGKKLRRIRVATLASAASLGARSVSPGSASLQASSLSGPRAAVGPSKPAAGSKTLTAGALGASEASAARRFKLKRAKTTCRTAL